MKEIELFILATMNTKNVISDNESSPANYGLYGLPPVLEVTPMSVAATKPKALRKRAKQEANLRITLSSHE